MEGKKNAISKQSVTGPDSVSLSLSRYTVGIRSRWAMLTVKEAKWPRALTTFRMCLQNFDGFMRLVQGWELLRFNQPDMMVIKP